MLEKGNDRTICSFSYSEHPSPSASFSWLLSSVPRRTQPEGAGTEVMSLGLFFSPSIHPVAAGYPVTPARYQKLVQVLFW